jgi:hypothetical protein
MLQFVLSSLTQKQAHVSYFYLYLLLYLLLCCINFIYDFIPKLIYRSFRRVEFWNKNLQFLPFTQIKFIVC